MELLSSERNRVYCVGNGRVAAYLAGANIEQIFAPCYSAPSFMSMYSVKKFNYTIHRLHNMPVYHTVIAKEKQKVGEIFDFSDAELPIFYRVLKLESPIAFEFSSKFHFRTVSFENMQAVIFSIPKGSQIFSESITDRDISCCVAFSNTVNIYKNQFIFPKGDFCMIYCGAENEDTLKMFCDQATNKNVRITYQRIAEKWLPITKKVDDYVASLNVKDEWRKMLTTIIQDTVINLITQTSFEGGILAGSFYHLAYGRDMFGIIKTLISLGFTEQAEKCIRFRINTFRTKGQVPNANGMGMSCSHIHENDEVEQTGYFLLELIELCKAKKSDDFLVENYDYALWALDAQIKHVHQNMLPFNGDETYIAGGLLPRTCLDHGSMEATLLMIEGGRYVLSVFEKNRLLSLEDIASRRKVIETCANTFDQNFLREDGYIVNNPKRLVNLKLSIQRHGVCVSCSAFGNIFRSDNDIYLCSECKRKGIVVPLDLNEYILDCVAFMTCFIQAKTVDISKIRKMVKREINYFKQYGATRQENEGNRCVGYEYGLLLIAITEFGFWEEGDRILNKLLNMRDPMGAWAEYYFQGHIDISSCPYRPWESAINTYAIINYIKHKYFSVT